MTLTDQPPTHDLDAPEQTPPTEHASTTVVVRPWHDEILARTGHEPRSEYVERFWLGVIGPSVVNFHERQPRTLH